jgi:hypothetical protein
LRGLPAALWVAYRGERAGLGNLVTALVQSWFYWPSFREHPPLTSILSLKGRGGKSSGFVGIGDAQTCKDPRFQGLHRLGLGVLDMVVTQQM